MGGLPWIAHGLTIDPRLLVLAGFHSILNNRFEFSCNTAQCCRRKIHKFGRFVGKLSSDNLTYTVKSGEKIIFI
jgi:hypothetical protein